MAGQQPGGIMPGAAGFSMTPAMQTFLGQQGQLPAVPAHALLTQRLAVLPQGARGGLAAGGQGYRAAAPQMPMNAMLKPPNRKSNASVKGRKSCNCKNSKCLKLYCECFASGRYCDNCNCLTCFNNKDNEAVRQSAVEAILERNPNAFRPKIQTAEGDTHPQSIRNAPDGSVRHTKGCNCKKSSCLKKYCECFQGGIFCTEICKCVDCKNYDGSEARAQVISHHGDAFALQAMAAQQTLKRPRVQQPMLQHQQGLQAGLMQQQLAAAVGGGAGAAAAAAAAAAMQPLQQLQALTAVGLGLPGAAAQAAGGPGALAAGAAGLTPAGSAAAALPQLPARPPILDAMRDLVKPELVDEIGSLLLIVAKEELEKHNKAAAAAVKAEPTDGSTAADGHCNGLKRARDEAGDAGVAGEEEGQQGAEAAKRAHTGAADGAAGEAGGEEDALQQAANGVQLVDGGLQGAVSALYAAQEGVVLQEFNSILQRILSQADKKVISDELAAAAAAAAAVGADGSMDPAAMEAAAAAAAAAADQASADQAAAAAAAAAAMYDGLADAGEQQQLLLQQMAEQLQQQQDLTQQQDVKQLARQQQQQQALAAQQALLMQAAAASSNLALLHASRGLYGTQQQQQLMQPMLGMSVPGLNQLRSGLQMVSVVAQDGSVHQVPAQALMQLQLAAGLQAAPQLGLVSQAPSAQQAVPVPAAAATVGGQQQVSLLSLLNGTGTTSGNSP